MISVFCVLWSMLVEGHWIRNTAPMVSVLFKQFTQEPVTSPLGPPFLFSYHEELWSDAHLTANRITGNANIYLDTQTFENIQDQ